MSSESASYPLPDLPGYRPLELLYSSSRVSVYRALPGDGKPSVVIKVLRHAYPSYEELVRFRNNYEIAKSLNAPGVYRPLALEVWHHSYALVMEDWGGISLDRQAMHNSLDLSTALEIAVQGAALLEALQLRRIVHKAIQPAHLLVNPQRRQIQAIDFSLAAIIPENATEIPAVGAIEGCPSYIAPEQTGRWERGIDCRSDFYSFGVTLYELLTGQLPFPIRDPLALIEAHLESEPIAPEQLNPEVPPQLAAIVQKLMAKHPEARYQTAAALRRDCDRARQEWNQSGQISPFPLAAGEEKPRRQVALAARPQPTQDRRTALPALDFSEISRIAQLFCSSLHPEELMGQIARTLREQSGCDRCVLLTVDGAGNWFVRALATPSRVELLAQPLAEMRDLPHNLLECVSATGEIFALNDRETPFPFEGEEYRPQNWLCLPLRPRDTLLGLLWCEHQSEGGWFPRERRPALEFLAAQGAIALENARLHALSREQLAEVAQKEEQYRSIFESVNNGLVVTDLETGTIVEINGNAGKITGFPREESLGRSIVEFLHPDSVPLFQDYTATLRAGGDFFARGLALRKDGTTFDFEAKAALLVRNGETYGAIAFQDISAQQAALRDRDRAEEALRESQQRLRAFIDNNPSVTYIKDIDGRYLLANRQYETLVSLRETEMLGKTDYDFFPAEVADKFRDNDRTVMEVLQPIEMEEVIERDGEISTYLSIKFPLLDETNNCYATCGISTDISDRKRMELELRKLASLQQAILDSTEYTIISTSLDGTIQTFNAGAERKLGYRAEEVINRTTPLLLHDFEEVRARAAILSEQFGRAIEPSFEVFVLKAALGAFDENEWTYIRKDGSRFPVLLSISAVRDESGTIIGYLGVGNDISDRKRAEIAIQEKSSQLERALIDLQSAQLQTVQSEKMASLGNLVAGVAHEINNPIGFLNGSIPNLSDSLHDLLAHLDLYRDCYPQADAAIEENAEEIELDFLRADLPKILDSMQGAVDRIKSITDSLRVFSRVDSEERVKADLHEGLESTLLILKYRLKANESRPAIILKKDYGSLPEIDCFPSQLNQVFMNILANAIDALDEVARDSTYSELESDPQILEIKTRILPERTAIEICIRDNGSGIPEELQSRIFDYLFTTKGIGKGTGLGLAISRQIVVDKHGGKIEVRSCVGEGTAFYIQLPFSRSSDS